MDLIGTTLSLSMVHVTPSGDRLGGQAFIEHYTTGTKTQISPLIKIQNKALRLICVAF
jgi:hypothetical protein